MGCSVIALCYDEHHKTHLGPFLVQRAVEAMLSCSTIVFNNDCLVARAKQLNLTKDERKQSKKDDHQDAPKKEEKKGDKKRDRVKKEEKEDYKGSESASLSEVTDDDEPLKRKKGRH